MILLKSVYVMTNYGNLFADDFTYWFIETFFISYQFQMYIYYRYAPDGKKLLFYLMLMSVYISIHLNLLENGLWTLYKRYFI